MPPSADAGRRHVQQLLTCVVTREVVRGGAHRLAGVVVGGGYVELVEGSGWWKVAEGTDSSSRLFGAQPLQIDGTEADMNVLIASCNQLSKIAITALHEITTKCEGRLLGIFALDSRFRVVFQYM